MSLPPQTTTYIADIQSSAVLDGAGAHASACRSNKPQSFQLVFHGRIGDRTATVELVVA